ncbi:secretin N-terminal domain-containing protein [Alkalimonas sp. MEB108]|uniref:Secretin N-terminal domain-containing protein n=1 Tax=Alkalimonas cellulosilytica TaxID=3058395 RepID=A0ABU7J4T4_9GAMM|nr:secretin N-terminal domain-containing protein [Alkalimonas sp. MEB108]MEE2001509.1 secretin N-terminal domain-containing protein [Alkalimonas sp. MEB108]
MHPRTNRAFSLLAGYCLLALTGCATQSVNYPVNPSRMAAPAPAYQAEELPESDTVDATAGFTRLTPLPADARALQQQTDLAQQFSSRDQHQLALNQLPMPEFIQQVFGEVLKVNYVIADQAASSKRLNLNVQEPISSRRLFLLTSQLLDEQNLQVSQREDVFYIHPKDRQSTANVVIGFGRRASDVPDTIQQVLQVVPLRYGIKTSVERTLRSLTSAQITADFEQNAYFIQGSRAEVLRALDLLALLDIPSSRGRYVGLLQLTYLTPDEFSAQLAELMQAEGFNVSTRATTGPALLMVPIKQMGAIALFAGDAFVLDRAEYWASQIDKPGRGNDKRFFIYHPRYARASDLGESVAPLIGASVSSAGSTRRDTQSAQSADRSTTVSAASSGDGDIRLTVDERSNTLLFYTTGTAYQSLLPIIQRLDVLPKQILLDATIAEVTLTDEFAQGFEFAFRSGRLAGGTLGALGVSEMGGFRLNWADGVSSMLARLSASSNLVNILSNPTLVVRDGVSANITVGNDIPTVGSTTINPGTETQSTSVVYRKTGVSLTVTPTINAQGLVVLEIDQSISNTSSGGPQVAGSPSIFERSIKTEVLAQSGQTVLLGGLISESNTDGNSHVPGISRVPLFGQLFKGAEQRREKTELVIFITPRVIDTVDEWQLIRQTVSEGLTSIQLVD